jgi:DNA (cytosine-5)-methyltransferase 1
VSELKRLQTFPDKYDLVGRRQIAIHQIGNSVPPQAARVVALAILQQVFSVSPPSPLPLLRDEQQLGFRKRKRDLTSVYRGKASFALGDRQSQTTPTVEASQLFCRARIGSEFAWQQPCDDGPLAIQAHLDADRWTVRVDAGPMKPLSALASFEILIGSHEKWEWALGKRTVRLIGGSLDDSVFIGVWKAFDAELARRNVKADLVQLCEYYQYRPRFSSQMTMANSEDERWWVLQRVVEGVGTREILTGCQIARLWECQESELLSYMLWLRSLAFEVRNNNTNSQIPQGSYLIPYTFPTLNPMSVQVRKSLVNDDERRTAKA